MGNKKKKRHHRNGHRHTFQIRNKHKVKHSHTSRNNSVSKHANTQNTPHQQTQEQYLVSSTPPPDETLLCIPNSQSPSSQTCVTQNLSSTTSSCTTENQNVPICTPNSHTQSSSTSQTFITHDHTLSPDSTTSSNTTEIQNVQCHVTIEGSRIINIEKLNKYINDLTVHVSKCGGTTSLAGEKRYGLASILSSRCTCGYEIILESSNKVKGPLGYTRWECNLGAVWGQMTTGGGHSPLQETMSVLGIAVMNKPCFQKTENDTGKWWNMRLQEAMLEAGREEKRLAEERNDFHQGVPAITVIVDGGWSKRSHKHSYNAKSGVGIIIGQATGKLLFIGARNKYCSACTQGISSDEHECYKNWDDSLSEMESDIILEGFKKAEATHGVRYLRFIGVGDSSVYPTLLQYVPVWVRFITKMECVNHACKCYRASLEKLAANNTSYKGKGGLTKKMRKRLTSAARCAIKMHSKEQDKTKGLALLKRDLINGPYHCFGHHSNYSPDFCQAARSTNADASSDQPAENEENIAQSTNDNDCICGKSSFCIRVHATTYNGNFTTNLAESWMHIRSKFDGGKVINRSQSGSWQNRCMGTGLQQNLGKAWGPTVWSEMTTSTPNRIFVDVANTMHKQAESTRKRKSTDKSKENRRKSKYARTENSVMARKAYSRHDDGTCPDEVVEDVPPQYLEELKDGFYKTKVKVTPEEATGIEQETREQHASDMWQRERTVRVTASTVGSLLKMRTTTRPSKKVETMLYSGFKGSQATRNGTVMEQVSRCEYKTYQERRGHSITTFQTGLVISLNHPWLAASPDDRVFDPTATPQSGLAEYKNPYSVRDKTLEEACKISSFCLEKKENGYRLKRRHDYYYQVQCQLYCDDKSWCDFVLRTDKGLHVERIWRDAEWWDKQLPKLKSFYFDHLLPELACPRYHKGGIHDH